MAVSKYTRAELLVGCGRLGSIAEMFDFIAEHYTTKQCEDAPVTPEQWKGCAASLHEIADMFQQMMDIEVVFNHWLNDYEKKLAHSEMKIAHYQKTIQEMEDEAKRQGDIISLLMR